MTTHKLRRCWHCSTPYAYQASGGGADEHNDSRYCPDCMKLVKNALKVVPVKFVKRWVPTTDYTKEQIEQAQNKRVETPGASPVRRITMGLVHIEDGVPSESQKGVCEMMADPVTGNKTYYSADWWDSGRYPTEVKKEVWWDIKKKEIATNQWDDR